MAWKSVLRDFTPPIVMRTLRPPPPHDAGYISATATVAAAEAAGLSVSEYVEKLWNTEGRTASFVARFHDLGAISPSTQSVVEIGPGTGLYVGQTLKSCNPTRYQIYEPNEGWASWLGKTYPVEVCKADGRSLKSTKSKSCDLIHAYGVFVYVPFTISYGYFKEIVRVARPGAFVIFNIVSEECLEPKVADAWLDSGYDYPAFLSKDYVRRFFLENGFRLVDCFFAVFGPGKSEYLVFQHQPAA